MTAAPDDTHLCMTPSVDLIYAATSDASSPEEAELRRRTAESGLAWEETVAGQMALERYDARVAVGENGGGFEALFLWLRGETS